MNILGAHIDSRVSTSSRILYEKWSCLSGYPLLQRHQKVSVGDYSAGHSQRHRQEGRKQRSGQHRRRTTKDRYSPLQISWFHLSKKQMEKRQGVVIEGETWTCSSAVFPLRTRKRRCQEPISEAAGRSII